MKTTTIKNNITCLKHVVIATLALVAVPAISSANNGKTSLLPDLNKSEIVAIDAVGDVLGDAGQVGVQVRDAHGNPLQGVTVLLSIENGAASLTNVTGITDNEGRFRSWLFSKVMTVATVSATIDTNNDGSVDQKMLQTEQIAFINSIMFNNGVGINIDTPDDSAVLHINSSDRGVLIPRVALLGCSDRVTILDPAVSLLVFNTNVSDSLDIGYVYFNGTDWVNFIALN
jgi:5-hydroxyisourate hydrolase-like protein (transthyretin family)